MSKVVDLSGKPVEGVQPNADVVQMLRECLASAEQGDVLQCAVVFRQADGAMGDCYAGTAGLSLEPMIGRLEVAKAALLGQMYEEKAFQ